MTLPGVTVSSAFGVRQWWRSAIRRCIPDSEFPSEYAKFRRIGFLFSCKKPSTSAARPDKVGSTKDRSISLRY
jgi:hypothetical protein